MSESKVPRPRRSAGFRWSSPVAFRRPKGIARDIPEAPTGVVAAAQEGTTQPESDDAGNGRPPSSIRKISGKSVDRPIARCEYCTGAYHQEAEGESPFCSADCRVASTRDDDQSGNVRPKHIVCAECGTLYPVKPRGVVPGFCSRECRRKHKVARAYKKGSKVEPSGANHDQAVPPPEEPASKTPSPNGAGAEHDGASRTPFRRLIRHGRNLSGKQPSQQATGPQSEPTEHSGDDADVPRSDLRLLRRSFREARPYRLHIVALFGLSLLSTPLALLTPVPLAVAVDSALGSEPLPAFLQPLVPASIDQSSTGVLLVAAVLLVLVALISGLQTLATSVLQTYTGEKLTLQFQSKLLQHVQRLSFAFHDSRGTADSIYRIQYDASSIQSIAVGSLIPFITAGFTLVSMLYIILRIDWQLALVAVGVSPFLYGYTSVYRTRMRPKYKQVKRLESSALSVVQEVLTSFRVVKAFAREDEEERRFVDKSNEGVDARIELTFSEGAYGLLVSLTTAIGTALVLYVGISGVQAGTLTLGAVLLVMSYVGQLYGPLKTVSRRFASLQRQLASADRAFELLDEVPDVQERPNAIPLDRAAGRLELRHVSFSYDGKEDVLRNVSFTVPQGSRVGVMGETGAGKTTLVSLLSRFYDPREGCILLDGVDLRDYKLRDLRVQFTIMLQEPVLFSTSIAENVAFARPGASIDEITNATRAAGAHGFVSSLPNGYDTVVGERGMRLSGGERQRISLARAFLKDAPILVLDEPTSSVDMKTEAAIMETVNELMRGRTTFVISHRLGTLMHCDVLLEIDHQSARMRSPDDAHAVHSAIDPIQTKPLRSRVTRDLPTWQGQGNRDGLVE